MDPCIYASQHERWLQEATSCPPTKLVCFRSDRKWVNAASLLTRQNTLPILFRQHDDTGQHFRCRFAARLVEVHFRDQFRNNSERRAWLDQKLWLQRKSWKREEGIERGEAEYKTRELDRFMAAQTWYIVQAMREIQPLPLPRLRKLANNQPLSPDFRYGYAVCQLPRQEIESLGIGPRLKPARQNYKEIVTKASNFRAGGESEEHRRLKEFVSKTPHVFQLPAGLSGTTEYLLPSGDSVDVFFRNGDEWIAVEVKARLSPEADVVRGIFQCIKYRAVIEAVQASRELPRDGRAILVLEDPLPGELVSLKNMLGVEVLDQVKPR